MNYPSTRLILFAPNVRSSGGRVLLEHLFMTCPFNNVVWFIPKDCESHFDASCRRYAGGFLGRIQAEFDLFSMSQHDDIVMMFNGSAPVLSIRANVLVYLQNRLLFECDLSDVHLRVGLRLRVENFLIRFRWKEIKKIIVQTESMLSLLSKFKSKFYLSSHPKLSVCPFVVGSHYRVTYSVNKFKKFKFFYPADFQPHKNHLTLILGWLSFIKSSPNSRLYLTLSREEIQRLIGGLELKAYELESIVCTGKLAHHELLSTMKDMNALVYPSLVESLGIPLLEATSSGLPIIASELDYVRDICCPAETFDPRSNISIFRALCRFCSEDREIQQVEGSSNFWKEFLDCGT